MKEKIVLFVKYFKPVYKAYYCICSLFVNVLKIFVRTDEKLILINSFGGKKYDDSPKILCEAMRKDDRFLGYKFVCAFHQPEKFKVAGVKCIKTDTLEYFLTALKARCWITNSSIERGLNFKGKRTFYFNTWHGTPIKKMGTDISKKNKSFVSSGGFGADVLTVQSDFEANVFSRVFDIPVNKVLRCGLPRNDKLDNYSNEERAEIKEKLGLPRNKKIILYAPTFREYERNSSYGCILNPPIDLKKWQKQLGEEYVLLFRAHYEVVESLGVRDNDFVKNVSTYENLNDLLIVADILISDYSSIFFDFSITGKPMLHFAYDYDVYEEKRGLYFDIRDEIIGSDNEDELIGFVKNKETTELSQITKKFRKKYVNYYGRATETALDCIYKNIRGLQ